MSSPLRHLALFTLASALLLAIASPGCSRQGEGERCDTTNGDSDCDSDLKCVADSKLVGEGSDRCCNPDLTTFSDSRCQPGSGSTTGGSGGSSTAGATSNGGVPAEAGGDSGGTAGAPVVPDETAGAAGNSASGGSGGVPATEPEGGNGGVPATPAGGQGGGD